MASAQWVDGDRGKRGLVIHRTCRRNSHRSLARLLVPNRRLLCVVRYNFRRARIHKRGPAGSGRGCVHRPRAKRTLLSQT